MASLEVVNLTGLYVHPGNWQPMYIQIFAFRLYVCTVTVGSTVVFICLHFIVTLIEKESVNNKCLSAILPNQKK